MFEVYEGDKSKVRSINIIGNEAFGDERLRKEMFTRQAGGILGFLKSNDSYDPDRLAADQQKLRAFYLTEGYADFRVVSALAELTPDRRDFVITYVVEEGPRYKLGTVEAESALRDLTPETIKAAVNLQAGRLVQRQGRRGRRHPFERGSRQSSATRSPTSIPPTIAMPRSGR